MKDSIAKYLQGMLIHDDVQRTMPNADPEVDFRTTLSLFFLTALLCLKKALKENKVTTHVYTDGQHGCLLFYLAQVTSKEELMNCPLIPADSLMAVRRTIRWWDIGALNPAMAESILAEVIKDRRRIENREKATLRTMAKRLAAV